MNVYVPDECTWFEFWLTETKPSGGGGYALPAASASEPGESFRAGPV